MWFVKWLSLFLLDSPVTWCTSEPTEWAASASENLLFVRACEDGAEDVHTCQHDDRGAQVRGSEGKTLEADDEAATSVVGVAWLDTWSSVGRWPCQEWNDCQGRAASCTGRNGSRGIPQTSTNCSFVWHIYLCKFFIGFIKCHFFACVIQNWNMLSILFLVIFITINL